MSGKSFLNITVFSCLATVVVGCEAKRAPNVAALHVEFSWEGAVACSPASPAFTLRDLPDNTKVISFHMIDRDAPLFSHGGGKVAYRGGETIPAGSFAYVGPCPPGGSHTYEWTVRALNADESLILGEGVATKRFPP